MKNTKNKIISFLTIALILAGSITGCSSKDDTDSQSNTNTDNTSVSEEVVEIVPERIYPDNAYKALDKIYQTAEVSQRGTVEKFTYQTKDNTSTSDKTYEKYCLVYLPAGYDHNDTETKYNVMYFMHGGSDSPEWFLKGEGMESNFSRLFDYMIDTGEMEPMIICFVSYYTEYRSDDTQNCLNFHFELSKDLIPAFESKYHTYAEDVTTEGIIASRLHRAFGGFSMGAVTTWATFERRLDSIAYYLPVSGDCWSLGSTAGGYKSDATAQRLQQMVNNSGYTAEDFYIYTGCGGYDIAEPNLRPQAEAMAKLTDTFIECDNFKDGNFYFCRYDKGGHDANTVLEIMYNGLPKMFG